MRPSRDYSRWGEQDAIVGFFGDGKPGRFLDLGAFDGVTESNTRALVECGWAGVCVEANPANFLRLLAGIGQYPKVRALCAAISPSACPSAFHESIHAECGTCAASHRLGKELRRSYYVGSVTAAQIAQTFGADFDFVSLDVEGVDLDVLPTLGPLLDATRLLCIEIVKPNEPFNPAYKAEMLRVAARLGFTRIVLETVDETKRPRNVLLGQRTPDAPERTAATLQVPGGDPESRRSWHARLAALRRRRAGDLQSARRGAQRLCPERPARLGRGPAELDACGCCDGGGALACPHGRRDRPPGWVHWRNGGGP